MGAEVAAEDAAADPTDDAEKRSDGAGPAVEADVEDGVNEGERKTQVEDEG